MFDKSKLLSSADVKTSSHRNPEQIKNGQSKRRKTGIWINDGCVSAIQHDIIDNVKHVWPVFDLYNQKKESITKLQTFCVQLLWQEWKNFPPTLHHREGVTSSKVIPFNQTFKEKKKTPTQLKQWIRPGLGVELGWEARWIHVVPRAAATLHSPGVDAAQHRRPQGNKDLNYVEL